MLGQDLIDLDPSYYSGLMNFTMRHQPNSAGKAHDDQGFWRLATSSLWRCGDNGWIAFETFCQNGVILVDGQKAAEICRDPSPNVPLFSA